MGFRKKTAPFLSWIEKNLSKQDSTPHYQGDPQIACFEIQRISKIPVGVKLHGDVHETSLGVNVSIISSVIGARLQERPFILMFCCLVLTLVWAETDINARSDLVFALMVTIVFVAGGMLRDSFERKIVVKYTEKELEVLIKYICAKYNGSYRRVTKK